MKKFFSLLLTLMLGLCVMLCFVGCGGSSATLKYGEKYFIGGSKRNNVEADKTYFIFNNDGTGQYHHYYKYIYKNDVEITDYTVTFSYNFMDADRESIVCTYESVEYTTRHNAEKDVKSKWDLFLGVSENILMTSTGTLYYSETYLTDHPNFCKD